MCQSRAKDGEQEERASAKTRILQNKLCQPEF